jgi:hypothetical protein
MCHLQGLGKSARNKSYNVLHCFLACSDDDNLLDRNTSTMKTNMWLMWKNALRKVTKFSSLITRLRDTIISQAANNFLKIMMKLKYLGMVVRNQNYLPREMNSRLN